jgi:hypothetical protein
MLRNKFTILYFESQQRPLDSSEKAFSAPSLSLNILLKHQMSNELRNLILNLYIFLKYQGMRVERSK